MGYTQQLDLLKDITNRNYSYTRSWKTKVTEIDEGVGKMKDNIATFNKSARWLKKYKTGASSGARLEKEINSLIKSYNEMSDNAKSTTDEELKGQMAKLDKLFSENEDNFNKIGVEKVKGKYKLDSKKFADADEEALNALFEGHNSFMDKADKIMRKTEESAESAHYTVKEQTVASVMEYNQADVLVASCMVLARESGKSLQSYNDAVQAGLSDDGKEAVLNALSKFAGSVYKQREGELSGNLEKLRKLCETNEEKLKEIGIAFVDDKKTVSFDPVKALPGTGMETPGTFGAYMDTAEFKDAYDELFGSDAEFGKKAVEYTKDVYDSIVKPDKIGVSVIDLYA